MKKLKNLIFLFFIVLFTNSSRGNEYILFKETGEDVALSEYFDCCEIIDKYQFPSSLQHFDEIKQTLDEEDFNLLLDNELEFIKKRVAEVYPDISVILLSKTLYELLSIEKNIEQRVLKQHLGRISNETANFVASYGDSCFLDEPEYCSNMRTKVKELVESCLCLISFNAINLKQRKIEACWEEIIGNSIFAEYKKKQAVAFWQSIHEFLKNDGLSFDLQTLFFDRAFWFSSPSPCFAFYNVKDSWKEYYRWNINNFIAYKINNGFDLDLETRINTILELAKDKNNNFEDYKRCFSRNEYFYLDFPEKIYMDKEQCSSRLYNILLNAIQLENENIYNNDFILYRGTNGYTFDGKERIDGIIKKSGYSGLSYGNSIFAGSIRDYSGGIPACCWSHFITSKYSYALKINKREYLESKGYIESDRIDPVLAQTGVSPFNLLDGILGEGESFHSRIGENLRIADFQKALELEDKFQTYLAENLFLLNKSEN